ncbi:C-X-C chemokine receptor type 5 [Lampris incognitus]|uniref:C-X-C chemokine receptor type 5 n=1 Tax=Lampris incognitus TaxID=2546036 RepID=UPI0024B4946F|nr:C-X-C chemokine receptor type 5 [Lampris incognitus]
MGATQNTFTLDNYEDFFSGRSENSSEYNSSDGDDAFICNEETSQQLFHAAFRTSVFGVVFLPALVGNGLMLMVLLSRRRRLRIAEIYLLHIALSDLLLVFTFPFVMAHSAIGWVFGEFLCKVVGLLNRLSFLYGSLLLACIGFDRYLVIVHAISSMQGRHPRTVHLTCISIWLVCLILSAPHVVFFSVIQRSTDPTKLLCFFKECGTHANDWFLTNRILTHMLCFFLPLAVMSYCYSRVIGTLRHGQRSQQTRGAIRLALLITAVFCLCWLPYNLTLLVDTMVELDVFSNQSCEAIARLEQGLVVTESLGFLHCCLNPILYAFVGVRFRNDLLQLLSRRGCRRICLPFIRAQGHTGSSVSERAPSSSTTFM